MFRLSWRATARVKSAAVVRPPRRTPTLRAAWLGCALLLLAGCSGVRLVYGQLDTLVPWYLGSYLDLDGQQKTILKLGVADVLDWHRSTQAAEYAAHFRRLQADAARPLGRERLERERQRVDSWWDAIVAAAVPTATDVLGPMTDKQLQALFEELADENAELAEKAGKQTLDERRKKLERSLRKGVERWTGPLDRSQRALVAAAAADMVDDGRLWIANRERWQGALLQTLNQRQDREKLRSGLDRLLASPEELWTDAYRRKFEADRARVLDLLEAVDRTLTASQREHLRGEFGRWAEDFATIARGG